MKNRRRRVAFASMFARVPCDRNVCAFIKYGAARQRATETTKRIASVRLNTELAMCQASSSSRVVRYSTKMGMNREARTPPSIRSYTMFGVMLARLKESAISRVASAVIPRTDASAAVRTKPVTLLVAVPRVITEAPRANEAGFSLGFCSFFLEPSEVSLLMLPHPPPREYLDAPADDYEPQYPADHDDGESVEAACEHGYLGLREDRPCLLYTSDAADDLLCVDLGGRRIIKKKKIPAHRALQCAATAEPRSPCARSGRP